MVRTLDSRPWQPGAHITDSGLVLNVAHVRKVLELEKQLAAAATTAIITKLMARS